MRIYYEKFKPKNEKISKEEKLRCLDTFFTSFSNEFSNELAPISMLQKCCQCELQAIELIHFGMTSEFELSDRPTCPWPLHAYNIKAHTHTHTNTHTYIHRQIHSHKYINNEFHYGRRVFCDLIKAQLGRYKDVAWLPLGQDILWVIFCNLKDVESAAEKHHRWIVAVAVDAVCRLSSCT